MDYYTRKSQPPKIERRRKKKQTQIQMNGLINLVLMQYLRFAHDTPPGRKKNRPQFDVYIYIYVCFFFFHSFHFISFISINPNLVEPFAN